MNFRISMSLASAVWQYSVRNSNRFGLPFACQSSRRAFCSQSQPTKENTEKKMTDVALSKEDAVGLLSQFVSTAPVTGPSVESYSVNATKYEAVVTTLDYSGPIMSTKYTHDLLKGKFDAKILDVGAGSGLSGQPLRELGYNDIDAVDASQDLLDIAKERNIYKKIMCQFVGPENPLPVPDDTYDLAVLSGAMGQNHLPLNALDDVIRVVRPGGYIVNVFREEAIRAPFYEGQFEPFHSNREKEGKWKQISRDQFPGFINGIPGLVLVHQVL